MPVVVDEVCRFQAEGDEVCYISGREVGPLVEIGVFFEILFYYGDGVRCQLATGHYTISFASM